MTSPYKDDRRDVVITYSGVPNVELIINDLSRFYNLNNEQKRPLIKDIHNALRYEKDIENEYFKLIFTKLSETNIQIQINK